MTALQVLKELKKEKWPELKTGEYNLPLILAAMHKFAELRQCNVSGALPPLFEFIEAWGKENKRSIREYVYDSAGGSEAFISEDAVQEWLRRQ